MKKRKLLFVGFISLLLAIGFAFTACSSDEGPASGAETLETLTATASVTATAYGPTGFIRVAWEPVSSANRYDLYRKSVDEDGTTAVKYIKQFTGALTTPESLTFDDKASFTNMFKVGTEYTYKVIAYTDWTTSNAEGLIKGESWTTSTLDDWLKLQNRSRNSNTVSFSADGDNALLAPGSKLASPKDVQLTKAINYSTSNGRKYETIQASWKTEPNVGYIINYSSSRGYDKQFAAYISESDLNPDFNAFDGFVAYQIPLIFGDVYVEVVAVHAGSAANIPTIGNTAKYYLDSDPSSATETFARAILNTPTNFSASEGDNGSVSLQWDKMWDAESYKVFRYKYNGSRSYDYDENQTAANVQIYENWAEVTDSIAFFDGHDEKKIFGSIQNEITDEEGASWQYLVISVAGEDIISYPASASVSNIFAAPQIYAQVLGWDIVKKDWSGIQIYWTPNGADSQYEVYRAPLYGETLGEAVNITTQLELQVYANGRHGYIDNPPYRSNYCYKLVATRGSKQNSTHSDITTFPYSPNFGINLYSSSTVATPAPSGSARYNAYDHSYTISGNKEYIEKLMFDTEAVRISRATTNDDGIENAPYAQVATFTKAELLSGILNNPQVVNLGPGYWRYKIEVIEGGAVVFAPEQPNATAAGDPDVSSLTMVPTSPGRRTFQVVSASPTDRINGTRLIIRYASSALSSYDAQGKLDSVQPNSFDHFSTVLTRSGSSDDYTSGEFFSAETAGLFWAA